MARRRNVDTGAPVSCVVTMLLLMAAGAAHADDPCTSAKGHVDALVQTLSASAVASTPDAQFIVREEQRNPSTGSVTRFGVELRSAAQRRAARAALNADARDSHEQLAVVPFRGRDSSGLLMSFSDGAAGRVSCGYVAYVAPGGAIKYIKLTDNSFDSVVKGPGNVDAISMVSRPTWTDSCTTSGADTPYWNDLRYLNAASGKLVDASRDFPSVYGALATTLQSTYNAMPDKSAVCARETRNLIISAQAIGGTAVAPAPATESPPTPPSIERVAGGLQLNGLNCALLPAKGTERLPNLGAVVTGISGRLAGVGRVATLKPFGAVTVGGGDSGLRPGTWQHTGVDIPSNGRTLDIRAADNGVIVFSSLDVTKPSNVNCATDSGQKPAICTFLARGGLVVIKHLVANNGDVLTVPAYKCPGNAPARICHDELSTGEVITYYLHLHPQTITVHTGDQVLAGQLIGHTYTDAEKKQLGLAYPPHLHLEVWRDCSTIERNGYEPEGAGFRHTVGRPLLDPLYFERAGHDATLGFPPKDSKGFAPLRLGDARAIAPLTPTVGTPGIDTRLAPTPRTTNLEIWRGTSANDFAIRPLRRVENSLFDSIAELIYQGRSFDPSLTVNDSSPGVWISWPDGGSRAVVIAWDNDGQNATYLLDIGVRQARQLQPGFFPREVYWSSNLRTALLIGPTGEGRLMGAVNVSTGKTLTKDISTWQLQTLRWLDANRIAFVGTEYDYDCSEPDPGGRCLGLKNPRPLLRIEDTRTWEAAP